VTGSNTAGPTVAVVMCTFDGAAYLRDQLCCIASQTRPPDLLFVFDDCSADDTVRILETFANEASFEVRFRRNPQRKGFNANFASALSAPETDFIAISDQDDLWDPDKLATLCALLDDDRSSAAACADAWFVDAEGRPTGGSVWGLLGFGPTERQRMATTGELGPLVANNTIPGHCMVFRSSYRDLLLPVSPHGFYDHWISVLLQSVSHFRFADRPLGSYRLHGSNAVGLRRPGRPVRDALRGIYRGNRSGLSTRRRPAHLERAAFTLDLLRRVEDSRYVVPAESRRALQEWAEFSTFRASLPRSATQRVLPVFERLWRGSYAAYTSGASSAFYDLMIG
jgi:glycosyltransferase involved in cell wall biosynthesis